MKLKTSVDIRQLYMPVQPTARQSGEQVLYSEFCQMTCYKAVYIVTGIKTANYLV